MEKVYLQLYSLGAQPDFVAALRRVSEAGYAGVEFAGGYYGDLSVADMKALLAELRLDPLSSHHTIHDLPDPRAAIDYMAQIGGKFILCPMAPLSSHEDCLRLAEKLNAAGALCKQAGLKYGYHNHSQEFNVDEGEYFLETLMANTDPSCVAFELDVYWAAQAGVEPIAFIQKHAGRFDLIHMKESANYGSAPDQPMDFSKLQMDADGKPIMTPEMIEMFKMMQERTKNNVAMGKGILDLKGIYDTALAQGAQAFIVEREYDYCGDIFRCVAEDCAFLKTL